MVSSDNEKVFLSKNLPNPSGSIIHFETVDVKDQPIAKRIIIKAKFKNADVKDSFFNFFRKIITAKIK